LECKRSVWRRLSLAVAVLGAVCVVPLAASAAERDEVAELRRQAEQYERDGQWDKALEAYYQILGKDRNLPEIKERCQSCLRFFHQTQRHRDRTYRDQVKHLPLYQALTLYEEVLTKLQGNYVDRDKTELTRLFQHGLEELRRAVDNPAFRRDYLGAAPAAAVREFRALLRDKADLGIRSQGEARAQVRQLAQEADRVLGLKPTAVVLEFACGACNALDEYTAYLTPGQLFELEGKDVGIGVEVTVDDHRLLVTGVVLGSPAALAGLKPGDHLVRVGRRPTANWTAETAAARLRGAPGSIVELEVLSPGYAEPRTLALARQAVPGPSVFAVDLLDPEAGVGYFHLLTFQHSTVQEINDALLRLQTDGMKVLILDLRGNPGGLFEVAVQVARRFLAEGVITSTQGTLRSSNRIYEANDLASLALPLVVLVDGETASAAEMLAGALKENQRARLVGQTTYGKGSLQRLLELRPAAAPEPLGGIRITLAKFFSPRGNPFSGCGVTPHLLVERTSLNPMNDAQLSAARQVARELALAMGR
jgi:carboxyl-terminal processing protease